MSLNDIHDMVILDFHVIKGAYPPNDVVRHGDHPHFPAAAELQVRCRIAQQHNIRGKATDVNDEGPWNLLQPARLRHYCGISLRIDHDMADYQANRCAIEDEVNRTTLKVVREPRPQRIVFRGQSYGQIRLHHGADCALTLQFPVSYTHLAAVPG